MMQYSLSTDLNGKLLDGGKCYKLHLPHEIPDCAFWSLIVYDELSGLMIRTEQAWPSVHSNCKNLVINPGGSMDVWFGPESPSGRENNWIKTIPGKSWYLKLRLYDMKESVENIFWKPGEIEELYRLD
jgi:hypothetical protein